MFLSSPNYYSLPYVGWWLNIHDHLRWATLSQGRFALFKGRRGDIHYPVCVALLHSKVYTGRCSQDCVLSVKWLYFTCLRVFPISGNSSTSSKSVECLYTNTSWQRKTCLHRHYQHVLTIQNWRLFKRHWVPRTFLRWIIAQLLDSRFAFNSHSYIFELLLCHFLKCICPPLKVWTWQFYRCYNLSWLHSLS